jgi:predicted AlkP superfamily phosphohydrolase/phosphomutase
MLSMISGIKRQVTMVHLLHRLVHPLMYLFSLCVSLYTAPAEKVYNLPVENGCMTKIVVVGFDGATWDIISPLISQGALPTFKALMDRSSWGVMESTMPPMTMPAWISMFSGLTPEQLCLFDFNKITVGEKTVECRLVNSGDCRGKFLWDLLSQRKMKSLVLNIPGIYPPYPIEGHLIGLDLTPLEKCTYPPELEQVLTEKHNLTRIREGQNQLFKGEKAALDIIEKEEEMVLDVAVSFCRAHAYDVAFVRFGIPDHVSHHSLDDNRMRECHSLMDNLLQQMQEIPCEYLILVSDHGIKREERVFNISRYLEDMGVLRIGVRDRLGEIVDRALDTVRKKFEGDVRRLGTRKRNFTSVETIYRNKSAALAYSAMPTRFCPLYITDDSKKDTIIKNLNQCEYIKKIHEVRCQGGPAALVESHYQIATRPGRALVDIQPRWYHDMKGIFLIQGKDVKKGHRVNCSICDIAPTLLHMLGVPIPDVLTGKVLTEVFEEGSEIRERTPQYVHPFSREDEKEKVRDSIRALGRLGKL